MFSLSRSAFRSRFSLSLAGPMPGLVPTAAGPRLLSRLAVLFSRQMAAAGLGEGGGGEIRRIGGIEASLSTPSRPRPLSRPMKQRRLAVAFSGGPDSAALGMLAGWWAGTARPPFAAVEEALRAERERAERASSSSSSPRSPPLPLSLALERWWRRGESFPFEKSCCFSDSFLETESENSSSSRGEDGDWRPPPLPLPMPLALVVDHGLRPGSRDTALRAALLARSLGLKPLIIEASWPSPEEEGEEQEGKQRKKRKTLEAARDARFAALLSAAAAAAAAASDSSDSSTPSSISALLVGHHADDQTETVALRLLRASGPAGLSGIPPRSWLQLPPSPPGMTTTTFPPPPRLLLCLRPLLPVPKSALLDALNAAGVTGWVRDPANGDLRPPRNRLRALLAGAAAEEAARGRGAGTSSSSPSSPLPLSFSLTKLQEREARRAAAAASRLAAALRARRQRVEREAARALEASELRVDSSPVDAPPSSPSPRPRSPRFLLRLAPLVSAGEAAGKAALAAVLDAAAAAEKSAKAARTPFSSSEAAAARLWGSISEDGSGGRLRGALTGARCVVRPVPGSKGREIVVRSAESDESERRRERETGKGKTRKLEEELFSSVNKTVKM